MMNYRYKLLLLCHTEIVEKRGQSPGRVIVPGEVKLYQTDTEKRKYPLNARFLGNK